MICPITVRAALLAATAVFVCAPPLAIAATAPTAVVLTPAKDGAIVTLKKRDTLTVVLADNNPSTGYSWVFTPRPNPNILRLVSDTTTPPPPPPTVGAAQPRTIVYTAATPGRTKFMLLNVGPGGQPGDKLGVTVFVARTTVCSVKRLRAVKRRGSVVFSVGVRTLLQTAGNCTRARHIAKVAARTTLAGRDLPPRIDGYKITAREPCDGCAPSTAVTATYGTARVTFTLSGGA